MKKKYYIAVASFLFMTACVTMQPSIPNTKLTNISNKNEYYTNYMLSIDNNFITGLHFKQNSIEIGYYNLSTLYTNTSSKAKDIYEIGNIFSTTGTILYAGGSCILLYKIYQMSYSETRTIDAIGWLGISTVLLGGIATLIQNNYYIESAIEYNKWLSGQLNLSMSYNDRESIFRLSYENKY